jgi:hypothetical protein
VVRNSPFKPDLAVTGVLYGLRSTDRSVLVRYRETVCSEFGTLTSPPLRENPQPTPVEPRFPDGDGLHGGLGTGKFRFFSVAVLDVVAAPFIEL